MMTEIEKYRNELREITDSNNLERDIHDLEKLNNFIFKFTNCLYENNLKMPYHLKELEGKYFRFGNANQSIVSLLKGNKFILITNPANLIDVFSLHSITRMQIESFIIMNYLFFDKVPDTEKEFRYDIYKLHGLKNQASFEINELSENIVIQKGKILNEMAETNQRIVDSQFYIQADNKQKKLYHNPIFAKLVDSKTLFSKFGLERTRIRDLWKLYSNSAHNEHISDRQYNSAIKNGLVDIDTYFLIISVAKLLTARLLKNLVTEFDCVRESYIMLPEKERVPIDVWSNLT
jgi:hypothetical protein